MKTLCSLDRDTSLLSEAIPCNTLVGGICSLDRDTSLLSEAIPCKTLVGGICGTQNGWEGVGGDTPLFAFSKYSQGSYGILNFCTCL